MKNNIVHSFRRIKKNGTATTFSIAGLAVGLICVIFIFLWIYNELTIDSNNKNLDYIYRVTAFAEDGSDSPASFEGCPPAVAPVIKEQFPQIKEACRCLTYLSYEFRYGDKNRIVESYFSDNSIFDIFTIEFIEGTKFEGETENSIVITQSLAKEYFGDESPIGKSLLCENTTDFIVVGVVKDFPGNSAFKFEAIAPLKSTPRISSDYFETWYNNAFPTFVLLNDPADAKVISAAIRGLLAEHNDTPDRLELISWKDMCYKHWNVKRNSRIFGMIALFVLIAAILNFINLNTARSTDQAKTIGLYKIMGASRMQLIRLVYGDIALMCAIAFLIAIIVVVVGLPTFSNAIGKDMTITACIKIVPILTFIGLYIITVLTSGGYSAAYLTGVPALQSIKSDFRSMGNKSFFRNAFISVIFITSMVILSSVATITMQIKHMQDIDVGINHPEQLMRIYVSDNTYTQRDAIKAELLKNPHITSAAYTFMLPSNYGNNASCFNWEGKDEQFKPLITILNCDVDLPKTYKLKMIEGETLREGQDGILINKAFADIIGWDSFVGKTISYCGWNRTIVGVFEDMKFNTLSKKTDPQTIENIQNWINNGSIVMRIETTDYAPVIKYVEDTFNKFNQGHEFHYGFLDEQFDAMIHQEMNLRKLIGIFSGFSILVLLLGLLGIIMYLIEQKTKEIGIRKCLGETVPSLVARFIKPFAILGIISGFFAVPISMYLMSKWLQNYSDRIELSLLPFILVVLAVILIAAITICIQSYRAASGNPVKALKYE